MRSFVQVLTTPTADTPGTTLLLHFDGKRYLIGSLAEGTQRASVQMGTRLLKVSECFITGRTEWSNTGGLIGMILTLADALASSKAASAEEAKKKAYAKGKRLECLDDGVKMEELLQEASKDTPRMQLSLYGPKNLNHKLATARRFVFRKGMPVDVHEVIEDQRPSHEDHELPPYYADQNIKVWAMSILPSTAPITTNESSKSGSSTPRKRSIDEVDGHEQGPAYERNKVTDMIISDDLPPEEHRRMLVKAVVGEMFNSSWRLDTLYETRLADVKLPASIFIRNPETRKVEKYRGVLPGGHKPLPNPDLAVLVRKPWPGALIESLPPTQPAKEALSYIIRNHTQRGKFNPKKAFELKVEKGPKFSKLSAGESVVNQNGETIHPEQVLGPSKEGGGFAVVDLPDPSYIENLIARPEWREAKVISGVGVVMWICGSGVASHPRLQAFMREMKHLKHIISSSEHCENYIALDSAAAATARLKEIDGKRYNLPVHSNHTDMDVDASLSLGDHVTTAKRGQIIQLEPTMGISDASVVKPLDMQATIAGISQDVLDEASKAAAALEVDRPAIAQWADSLPSKNAEITTLGTGSALPSKYRNVSSTLLRVPGWGSMLFDCGENTLGQLKRVFTPNELSQILHELKIIIISHMHADHHLGTVGVIKAWYQEVHGAQPAEPPRSDANVESLFEGQKRLAVVAEPAMQTWLDEYAAVEDYGLSRLAPLNLTTERFNNSSKMSWFIPPQELASLHDNQRMERTARSSVSPSLLGLQDIKAAPVQHCQGARAVSLTWPDGFKVSYSGDCRPSDAFARIGQGSIVCIHEATFDDELQGDAEAKNHSTTSEALGVAQAMGARACVLTHFSQRYQKLPVLEHSTDGPSGDIARPITHFSPSFNGNGDEEGADNAPFDNALENDVAETFPDQPSAGDAQTHDMQTIGTGRVGDLTRTSSAPEAVKFKMQSDMKVCVAFDYMRVKVGDIAEMQYFTPALLKLFAEESPADDASNGDGASVKSGKEGKQGKMKGKKSVR